MITNTTLFALLLGATLAGTPALAQEEVAHTNDIAVQGFGSFVRSTVDNGVSHVATNTGGVLASYRFFFNEHNGVELSYGLSSSTHNYGAEGNIAGIDTHSHELSAAYVVRFPMRRVTPFALAGVGGLIFNPRDVQGATTEARAAFVYGGGADFSLTRRFFMRAQYRGLLYKSPTYDLSVLSGTGRVTHTAEPSLGFGWRF